MCRSLIVACGLIVVALGACWPLVRSAGAAPGDAPAAAAKTPRFVLRGLQVGKSWEAFRLDTTTGETWRVFSGDKYNRVDESGTVAKGAYDLLAMPMSETEFAVLRIEQGSGRTWTLSGVKWQAITEPQ